MKCIGIFMPVATTATLENDELLMEYLEAYVDEEGALIDELPDVEKALKASFGQHLSLVYYDPQTRETMDTPGSYYHLMVVSDSVFHSHERH